MARENDMPLGSERRRADEMRRNPAGSASGRPPAFDAGRYKECNTVERCFSKFRQFRAIAPRYDKREPIHQGTVDVASIRSWIRDPVR
jgi:transposase